MKIEKGQLVKVSHSRKGTFVAVALADFDTDEAAFFPVAVAEGYIEGMNTAWVAGEKIPCRASFAEILKVLD